MFNYVAILTDVKLSQILAEPFYSDRREWWPVGKPPHYKSPFFHYHAGTMGVQEVQANIEVQHPTCRPLCLSARLPFRRANSACNASSCVKLLPV